MNAEASDSATKARLIAMGSEALTQGFALIGFETFPNAGEDDLRKLLRELIDSRQQALIFLEPELARCDCPELRRVRVEGGRILVTEVPPLHLPAEHRPLVEELVANVLGEAALEEST